MRHLVLLSLVGCTGFSLGENTPGGDTWTDPPPTQPGEHKVGAIAVERDEDQLWVVHEENRAGDQRARLAAIDPITGTPTEVLDVSGTTDRRVVFPGDDRMLLMAQDGGTENLVLFDTRTRTRLRQTTKSTWYWGTRTAPSGRALVVADNADPKSPLHVIDTATLGHQVLPHGGDLIEAMWNHGSDVLLALSVTDPFGDHPSAKLLRYDFTGADLGAPLPAPAVKWQLDGYGWDFFFSFTWIGISPDDHWAVFPVIKHNPDSVEHVLLVLDQITGAVTLVPGSGPVGFTRDSRFIVSYGTQADGTGEELWLIDPVSRTRTTAVPAGGGITFFPMHDSDFIAVAPSWGSTGTLAVYDATTREVRDTGQTDTYLVDFVTRPGHAELVLESGGAVFDFSLADATITPIALPGGIQNINARPSADLAYAADRDVAKIYAIDMATSTLATTFALPSPFTGNAPGLSTARRAPARFAPAGRLTTRREHDGDARSLDR